MILRVLGKTGPLAFLESHLPQQECCLDSCSLIFKAHGSGGGVTASFTGVRPGGRFTLRKLVGKGWGPALTMGSPHVRRAAGVGTAQFVLLALAQGSGEADKGPEV